MLFLKPLTRRRLVGRWCLRSRLLERDSHLGARTNPTPSLSLRIEGLKHPNTRIYVRLLGPCFQTGRRKPFRQSPECAVGMDTPTPSTASFLVGKPDPEPGQEIFGSCRRPDPWPTRSTKGFERAPQGNEGLTSVPKNRDTHFF